MNATDLAAWQAGIASLMRDSRFAAPSTLADVINAAIAPLQVEVELLLVDREQATLRAMPRAGRPPPEPLDIDSTAAGRAFTTLEMVVPPGQDGHLWVPVLDDAERLGVLDARVLADVPLDSPALQEGLAQLSYEVGHLLVAKAAYGDTIRRTRRSRAMSTEGEMLWRALPPLTFVTSGATLAAALEPCYDVGGDAFDYAIDYHNLRASIFDAVGHGLTAALTSTLTLAATRAARASGLGLPATAAAADHAITSQFEDLRYATAVLAELDTVSGSLRYLNAGHPPPVLVRDSKVVTTLDAAPRLPLGLPEQANVAEESLEPGDRVLFYTDGIIDARDANGAFFGLDRMVDQIERHTVTGLPVAETLRRLANDVLAYQDGQLSDDATLMILEWRP